MMLSQDFLSIFKSFCGIVIPVLLISIICSCVVGNFQFFSYDHQIIISRHIHNMGGQSSAQREHFLRFLPIDNVRLDDSVRFRVWKFFIAKLLQICHRM